MKITKELLRENGYVMFENPDYWMPGDVRTVFEFKGEGLKNIILYSKATIEIDDKDVNINELNITIRTLYAAIKIDWQDILEFT